MSPDEHEEMTAAAIARLAGVGRAAVSNWRRRYPDFPQPVGGDERSPTFSRSEVEEWLKATGKGDQLATAGRTDTGTQRVQQDAPLRTIRGSTILLETPERESEFGIADLDPAQLLAKSVAALLPRSIGLAESETTDSALLPAVLDPACFSGTMLMAVADRFGNSVKLVGQEIDASAAAAADSNLYDNAYGTPYEIHTGDSFLDNQLSAYLRTAAAVVCEPSFDLPRWPSTELSSDPRWKFGVPMPRDSELAWVQHCYAHLRPKGTAVITVTRRTCVQPSGQGIREALVSSGALRDVIALPKGIGSTPDTETCLWVLQRPYDTAGANPVRMADLSGLSDAASVPSTHGDWEELFTDAPPAIVRLVPRRELLDSGANLLPSRHISAHIEATPDDFTRVTERLQGIYANIGRGLPHFTAPLEKVHHAQVTLGELERSGALTIQSREATPRAGDLLVRTLGRPPVIATGGPEDESGVAQVVEIDGTRLDAHFLVAFLRADANALPMVNTHGALSREDLRRCRVPRIPLSEQHRYGKAFRHLRQLEETLAGLAKASSHVIDQTIHGLITGVLAPEFAPTNHTDEAETADDETREL
ncbi:N-6 DNA methylase [Streptomyces avidinii]